ncbi:MAG: hypothetical protein WDN23_05220 [Edaphobacter sp.]
MISFLSRVHLRIGHVSDETLASFISGELSSLRAMRVNTHLGRCWQCRGRRDELERAALLVVEYRRGNLASCTPLDPGYRRSFLAKVEETTGKRGIVMPRFRFLQLFRRLLHAMNPVFASVVVLSVCGVLLFWIWQRSTATVSAQELLRLAEASEREHSEQHSAGVLYQQVAVDAGTATLHHSIYRDLSGHRKTHPAPLNPAETRLRNKLEVAGVDWEQPLSAKDYSEWHDRQTEIRDDVERIDKSKLTLTTKLSEGEIAEETLTVREADFHPIGREIVFRDSERIQIAELNYSILPWSAVNASLFEPLVSDPPRPALGSIVHRLLPSSDQLMGAQLQAELALMKLHANTGEDIHVEQDDSHIYVRGVVETDDRKREIDTELRHIPFVKPDMRSIEEIERMRHASSSDGALQVQEAELQPSPLDTFLSTHAVPEEQGISLSRILAQASVVIAREAQTLSELDLRYGDSGQAMNEDNLQLLGRLKKEHLSILNQALNSEELALAPYASENGSKSTITPISLSVLATSNQRLCAELLAGSNNNSRPASEIINDLVRTSSQIRSTITHIAITLPPT